MHKAPEPYSLNQAPIGILLLIQTYIYIYIYSWEAGMSQLKTHYPNYESYMKITWTLPNKK